jgi:hypothetical protein
MENVSATTETCHECFKSHKCAPCHHGMMCHQVADGGDGLQIWRVDTNILNNQSWTADRGWSSSLGDGLGANYSSL